MVGFIPATLMILINGFVNTYTVHLQTRVKESIGGGAAGEITSKVKTYTDLGEVCFGKAGLLVFSVTIMANQILTCTGYVKFFIEQLDILTRQVLSNDKQRFSTDEDIVSYNYKGVYCILAITILTLLSRFRSMRSISYVSLIAMVSIVTAVLYLVLVDVRDLLQE